MKRGKAIKVVKYIMALTSVHLVFMYSCPTADAQEYTADLEQTVVRIISSSGREQEVGTGFVFLIKQGKAFILTANHVVTDQDCFGFDDITTKFAGDLDDYEATIYESYEEIDIAILLLKRLPKNIGMLKLGRSADLRGGEIYIYGYPGGGIAEKDGGRIRSKKGNKILLDDISPAEGNSGGPLLDMESNEVIGIILQKSTNLENQYAMEIDQIKLFLEKDEVFSVLFGAGANVGSADKVNEREMDQLLAVYVKSFEKKDYKTLENVYKEPEGSWSGFFTKYADDKITASIVTRDYQIQSDPPKLVLSVQLNYSIQGKRYSSTVLRSWTLVKRGGKWVVAEMKRIATK